MSIFGLFKSTPPICYMTLYHAAMAKCDMMQRQRDMGFTLARKLGDEMYAYTGNNNHFEKVCAAVSNYSYNPEILDIYRELIKRKGYDK